MRPYVILPVLAILNIANAAALPMGLRHPPPFHDSHNRRQLHNADFSSSTTKGPGAISTSRGPTLDRRLISVGGAKSTSLVNGDLSVSPRQSGSRGADIAINVRMTTDDEKETNLLVSPQDPSAASGDDAASDPLVSRAATNVLSRQDAEDPAEESSSEPDDPVVSRDIKLAATNLSRQDAGADDPDTTAVDPADEPSSDPDASDDTLDPVVSRDIKLAATNVLTRQDSGADDPDTTAVDPAEEPSSDPDASDDPVVSRDIAATNVLSRQDSPDDPDTAAVDPAEESSSDPDASDDTPDPVVSRDIKLDYSMPHKRMVSADTPVTFPIPGTVFAASRNPLAREALLHLAGTGTTATLNSDSPDSLGITMALPTTPQLPSLPRDVGSVSPPATERRDLPVALPNLPVALPNLPLDRRQSLPAVLPISLLKVPTKRQLPALPSLPIPLPRDASINDVSTPTVDSGVHSASVPRSFLKEERL